MDKPQNNRAEVSAVALGGSVRFGNLFGGSGIRRRDNAAETLVKSAVRTIGSSSVAKLFAVFGSMITALRIQERHVCSKSSVPAELFAEVCTSAIVQTYLPDRSS